MTDQTYFELPCSWYCVCPQQLFYVKGFDGSLPLMCEYQATNRGYKQQFSNVRNKQANKTYKSILYLFFKLTFGKKRKKNWAFGLSCCKSFIKRLLDQSIYKSTFPQKSKSPVDPNAVHFSPNGLDWNFNLQSIGNQLIMGGRGDPVQKPSSKPPFVDRSVWEN